MRTFSAEGVILKRTNSGEADRILTIFTKEYGKLACIAKGVRKTTSKKRSSLEPGTHTKLFFAGAHGLPILTQTQLIEDYRQTRSSLRSLRQLSQVLEMVEALTVENQEQPEIFSLVLEVLGELSGNTNRSAITSHLRQLIVLLGYQDVSETKFHSIMDYVEYLSSKKMKSFSYLTVKN